MLTLPWRQADARKPTNPGAPPGPPLAAKHGAPFNTGWTIFYTRRLYKRIEDCWNRPIAGQAATFIDVLLRKKGRGDGSPHELTGETKNCLNLGSYNYLGFGGYDPICTKAVIRTLREHGVSACSSRMEGGTTPVHAQLESTVATFLEKEAAIVIGMGFATNSAVIPVVVDPEGNGKGVLLISDALNHSSIVEGVRGSGAKVQPFAHNNMGHLEAILRRATEDGQPSGVPWRKIVIVVEGIYSMEGQFARLREIVALKKSATRTCTWTRRTRSARSARAAARHRPSRRPHLGHRHHDGHVHQVVRLRRRLHRRLARDGRGAAPPLGGVALLRRCRRRRRSRRSPPSASWASTPRRARSARSGWPSCATTRTDSARASSGSAAACSATSTRR